MATRPWASSRRTPPSKSRPRPHLHPSPHPPLARWSQARLPAPVGSIGAAHPVGTRRTSGLTRTPHRHGPPAAVGTPTGPGPRLGTLRTPRRTTAGFPPSPGRCGRAARRRRRAGTLHRGARSGATPDPARAPQPERAWTHGGRHSARHSSVKASHAHKEARRRLGCSCPAAVLQQCQEFLGAGEQRRRCRCLRRRWRQAGPQSLQAGPAFGELVRER